MTTFRLATQNDCEVDLRALEELVSNPRKFYELIATINSAVYSFSDGPALEE